MVEDGEAEDVENGFDTILTNVTATKNSFQQNVESQLANGHHYQMILVVAKKYKFLLLCKKRLDM